MGRGPRPQLRGFWEKTLESLNETRDEGFDYEDQDPPLMSMLLCGWFLGVLDPLMKKNMTVRATLFIEMEGVPCLMLRSKTGRKTLFRFSKNGKEVEVFKIQEGPTGVTHLIYLGDHEKAKELILWVMGKD